MKKFFKKITNKWLLKGTTTLLLVAIVIACYIGLNWGIEQLKIENFDFSANKKYSLSDETKGRLSNLESEITIQLINMNGYQSDYVSGDNVIDYAKKYEKASDKIKIEEINDLSSRVDLQTKYNITSADAIVVVKNGDREKVLTDSNLYTIDYVAYQLVDATEEAITNAIIEVTIEEKPQIYVLSGKTYYDVTQSLAFVAQRLIGEANEMELLDILTAGEVPEDCDCLVITTQKQDISELERDKILEYINNGGKILMLTSQNIINLETPNLNQVLAQYGISIEYGAVFEQDTGKMVEDSAEMIVAEAGASFMDQLVTNLKICMLDAGKIQFADETKLEELGVTYETIAKSSEKSFVRTKFDIQSKTRTNEDSEEGECILGALVNKKISEEKNSQLIIYSNEVFASTMVIPLNQQHQEYAVELSDNKDVILNSVSYLIERDDSITIRKTDKTEKYTVTDQQDIIIDTIIFAAPGLILLIGIAVWIYRRRKV